MKVKKKIKEKSNLQDLVKSVCKLTSLQVKRLKELGRVPIFVKTLKKELEKGDITWDKFFDKVKVPYKNRSDFLVSAILKQYKEIYGEYPK